MAENQTASEDSGQQQQQQQQQLDQQQNNQQPQQQDSSPDQDSSSDSITPNPRSKTMNMRNSLTSIKVPRAVSSTTNSAAEGSHQSHGSGKHHHHNHHHNHLHNNAGHHVIHRTTSESLRLGSDYTGGSSSMTNSTSNSSSTHGGSGSSSTTPNNSNTTTSNHSHSMSSTSSHSHSHPHSHSHSSHHPHSHQHISNSSGGPMQRKQKTSSFQITSVTVGNKLSSDNGDDSADDLDESHTDDNSRITDLENETPSVSEDTFSKEDVFFANNALSTTAPVIPTSAQYGLVVVDPIGPSVGQTIQNVQVNVADNIINVVSAVGNKKKPEVKETQHRSERFKVVKIESTEPFRRGRWMCMDYLDHSGNQVLNKDITPEKNAPGSSVSVATAGGEDSSRGTTQTGIIVTNDANAAAGTATGVENHIDAAAKLTADGNLNIYRSESQTSAGTGQNTNQTITHAHTLGGPINMQQQQQQQVQAQLPNQFQGQNFEGGHGQTMPLATDFQQQSTQLNGNDSPSVTAGQSQPASFFSNQLNAPSGSGAGGGSTPASFKQPQQQQQQATPVHGVTLPANIHMQNGNGGGGNGNGTNLQPVSFIPPSVASSGADISGTPATSVQQQTGQQSNLAYTTQPATNVAPQSYPSGSNLIGSAAYNNASVTQQLVGEAVQPATQHSDSNAATSPSSGGSVGGQPQQFQPVQSNPLAGQTMPILNQMTYDIQSQQQPSQSPSNSPATISDPTAIAATIQQQQQIDNNTFTTNNNNVNTANNNNNNNNNNTNNNQSASSSSTTAESSTNITTSAGGGGGSGTTAPSNNISSSSQQQQQPPPPSSSSSLSVAGSIQGSTSGGSAAATSTTGSNDEHQLHHNPETETERYVEILLSSNIYNGHQR